MMSSASRSGLRTFIRSLLSGFPPRIEGLSEGRDFFGVLVGEVGFFVGVFGEVVKLGFSCLIAGASGVASVVSLYEGGVVDVIDKFPVALDDVAGLAVGGGIVDVLHVVVAVVAEDHVAFGEGCGVAEVEAGHGFGHFKATGF